MTEWPFGDLRMFGYEIIYADPAWSFETWSEAGQDRSPSQHYETMTIDEIAALPVGQLASRNCALCMWVVDPLLDVAIDILKAWGFRITTVLFTWTKEKPSGAEHIGTGYYSRANPEMCLLGMTGRLPVLDRGIRQWQHHPVREHSRKPDAFANDIVRMFGDRPRVELFSRSNRPGWDHWGKEVGKFDAAPPVPRAQFDFGLPLAETADDATPI